MNLGYTVGAVRAYDSEVGHTNVLGRVFLDQAHPADTIFIARKTSSDFIEQTPIDFEDDLQMTRQQSLEPGHGPFLQGLGQQRVIRVCKSLLSEVPRLIPSKLRIVEQYAHQLSHG